MTRRNSIYDSSSAFDVGFDLQARTIYIAADPKDPSSEGEINSSIASQVIMGLGYLTRASLTEPIKVILNSPGGSIYDGMAIYDALKACPCPVKIIVLGQACSIACVILQAGDVRLASPYSTLMFHIGSTDIPDKHTRIVQNWVAYEAVFGRTIDDIIYNSMKNVNPKLTKRKFNEMNSFDKIMTAQEAVDIGLLDGILENSELYRK